VLVLSCYHYQHPALPKVDFREYHQNVNSESFAWSARRILVVEDEAAVRELLMRVLQDAGYLVAAAKNGTEAVEMAEHQPPFDLLITDYAMRGMNGVELAKVLRAKHPDLKVLITSTFRPEQLGEEALPVAAEFLEKPWTPHEMIDRVRTVLARRSSS
jgi:CheY-like chemotaxis protein